MPLIDKTGLYDYVKKWSEELYNRGILISGYVIMPNHIQLLVYVAENCKGFNMVIGEAKRFMAYEIVKRLTKNKEVGLLKILTNGVQLEEKLKGKKHQVFRLSFDAKEIQGEADIIQVLEYIHHNPVSKKWKLSKVFTDYPYSSAKYYEYGEQGHLKILDYRDAYQQ